MDEVKPTESKSIDEAMALFFYGCNIPFLAADSEYFKAFVKALRPAYKSPNRRRLAGDLLDTTHEKIDKRNLELIKKTNNRATLLVDGWKNSAKNHHYVVMMLATSDDQKVFLEAFDFSDIRETGENLIDAVDKAIALAKERYDADVYAVLTDNAYNMQCLRSASESLHFLYSTCNAHSANLLAGDILKVSKYSSVMSKVMTVQKDFRRTTLEDRLLKAGGKKPVLFSNTRWASQRDAAESLVKNLSAMKKVAAICDEELEIDPKATVLKPGVASLIFNSKFITSVKELLELLDPVAELTNFCQKSESSAADAVEKWLKLLEDGPEKLRNFLNYRLNESNVLNVVTMTSNFFHPVYRGQRLTEERRKEVTEYIFDKLETEALESFRKFSIDEGAFASLKRKKLISPKTYWHFASELGHRDLAAFATDYLKIPASTAQLERLFSNWGYVHSDIRNRLSDDRSKKLVDIYFTLRSTDPIENDDADEDFETEE